jgi:hypothetical protein
MSNHRLPCLIAAVLWGPLASTLWAQAALPAQSFPVEEPSVAAPFLGEVGPAQEFPVTPGPAETLPAGSLPSVSDEDYDPDRPRDARSGFFQGLGVQATWLAGGHGPTELGMADFELDSVFALPLPKKTWPLVLTPTFDAFLMQVPRSIDLPARLYDAYMDLTWYPRLSAEWRLALTVDPGVYSDFEEGTAKGIRVPTQGAAIYTWSPTTKIVFGAAYLDRRSGIDEIPVGGIIWKPRDDLDFELIFPKPKIAWRVDPDGNVDDDIQHRLYLAGEFGSEAWEVRRNSGLLEQVGYTDYRLLLGFERTALGGPKLRVETGYVFGRQLRYVTSPDVDLSPTLLLRAGATF